VRHFGKEAEDCENWQDLWHRGWLDELTNPGDSATYQPNGLPRDEDSCIIGGWVDELGKILAPTPSIYSKKYPFIFTKALVNGGPALISEIQIDKADEIDCDQIAQVIDTVSTYLNNYSLRLLRGTGHSAVIGKGQAESFFEAWDEKKDYKGLFICRFGVAIPGQPIIPSEVAANILQMVRRQIEAQRQRLVLATSNISDEGSKPNDPRLTAEFLVEYRRFFRPYASLLAPEGIPSIFARWLANGEAEDPFRAHDYLIARLENIYADTAEPECFLACLRKLLEVVRPLLDDDQLAPNLFVSESLIVFLEEDSSSKRPVYGTKSENRARAQHACRRVERWLRLKQKAPLSQLLAHLTTLPVIVRPVASKEPYQGLKSEICLPVYEHEDAKHILDQLLPNAREALLLLNSEAIQQALLAPLTQLTNFSSEFFSTIKSRAKQGNSKNEIERLPEYYPPPFFEWDELRSSKHLLNTATVSPHFWTALTLSLTIRHHFAKMLYELYSAPVSPQEKQARDYVQALLYIPVEVDISSGVFCYNISSEILGYDDYVAKILSKKHKFEQSLSLLKKKHLRPLRHKLLLFLGIDLECINQKRSAYERGDYALNMLVADFPVLYFNLLDEVIQYPQVGSLFWGGIYSLVHYGQLSAREAVDAINARLGEKAEELGTLKAPLQVDKLPEVDAQPKKQFTLAQLCSGGSVQLQESTAEKIKAVWDVIRENHKEIYPSTAGAAVIKVAQWLGKVKSQEQIPAAQWIRALRQEWEVEVTEGTSKYKIGEKRSKSFNKAVQIAFELFKEKYPGWAKGKDLPSIYQ
jgi:hypothetical protein